MTSSDGSIKVMTEHSVCRYGELWNTPPMCPYFACQDADGCTRCSTGWAADPEKESFITDALQAELDSAKAIETALAASLAARHASRPKATGYWKGFT